MAEMTASTPKAHHDETALHNNNQKLAMWLYLASEVVIFTILIGGYALFRLNEPAIVKNVHKELGVALVTANTFLLLSSSWAMVMSLRAIQMKKRSEFMAWMGVVVALGVVFLIGQFIEYRELAHLQITLGDVSQEYGGFGARFYAPTAFHGLHVLIGVLLGLHVLYLGNKGFYDNNPIGVEIFGLYWHFVDVVWIILFTLIYLI